MQCHDFVFTTFCAPRRSIALLSSTARAPRRSSPEFAAAGVSALFIFGGSSKHVPAFGLSHNLTSKQWWFHVFCESYLKTILEFGLEEDVS